MISMKLENFNYFHFHHKKPIRPKVLSNRQIVFPDLAGSFCVSVEYGQMEYGQTK